MPIAAMIHEDSRFMMYLLRKYCRHHVVEIEQEYAARIRANVTAPKMLSIFLTHEDRCFGSSLNIHLRHPWLQLLL